VFVHFSANGEYFASGGSTSSTIYHTGTGKKIWHFLESTGGIFSDVYLNPDTRRGRKLGRRCVSTNGKYLVTGGDDRNIRIWDIVTGEAKGELKGHASTIVKVEISGDGNNLLSASQDGIVIYWDLERQVKLFKLSSERGRGAPRSLAISPNGNLLAAAGFITDYETGNEVLVWNTDGKLMTTLETGDWSRVVQFSPDGNELFVGGFYGSSLWEFDSQVKENGGWRSKCGSQVGPGLSQ
jgi:general transcriptional corepressor TUP1